MTGFGKYRTTLKYTQVLQIKKQFCKNTHSAARLERSSFLWNEVEQKKREWKTEMSAIKKQLIDIRRS